ncbi:DNA gyrase subunit A [Eubacterium ventriosum]|uniref:DNA gyrase subunit A n=2 Tax=Eubacterium ventriosum TaxID=39496 RepID=A0A415LIA1_9FIRM|nr:DNA gyrase subunit A [Eubacterium ventriosum]RHA74780.1 DNA gyrase subunit A [Eubacterium ventriosum]RHL48251.1 DNA gyrase subunit A [Eubacterium ventriosum]
MDDKIFDKIHEVDLKETMETSYIDYAMSVIASRALPDVRDGLKPVQRRVLYSMVELNNGPDKPHRKCARIVGDTMGKFHPHGDSSIYGALVNMAQEWNTRYPLVDGHGNFGSEDGDGAAAMRYTEARLSKISMEMVADINKDTVEFTPNFDETEKEPSVLPSRYPNLLVNGTSGIAVGMATNIPPHNLTETINAIVKIIDNKVEENRDTTIEEIMEIIKGPDFPTGATILGRKDIEQAYRTGRGKIKTRAVSEIETMDNGKSRIIVTELPYMVNKAKLVEKIASLVKEKKVDGITDLRDESDQEGTRVVIEVRRDANANVILNQLYKHTQLQDSFGVIMLALVDGEPKVLNLLQMLDEYLKHQKDVVTRRTKFELNKAEERAHIIKGLLIALDNIDEVIKIIRGSRTTADAKKNLIERFGLSDAQSQAIVDMRLRQLTGLAREDLEAEYADLMAKIDYLKSILADENKLLTVIKEEIEVIRDKFGDERRTKIGINVGDLSDEDLIPEEDTVVAMTNLGYIKRMTVDNFKSQNRGGKGIKGMQTIDKDFMKDMFMVSTHDYILFLTNTGRIYKLKCYEIPEAGRTARGMAIVNLLQLQPGEKISAMVQMKEFEEDKYLIMATKKGTIKKTPIMAYTNIRKSGIQAITLREDDELIDVNISDNNDNIMLITKKGQGIKFRETDVRETGRSAMGVRGIELNQDDEVISMQLESHGECVLIVSANGMGKRTPFTDFKLQNRGGKGVKCYKISDKTGEVVGAKAVNDGNEIMMITNEGIVIRMFVDDISILGRVTLGVKLMNTGDKDDIVVASITKVKESVTEADALEAARLSEENETLDEGSEELSEDSDSEDN